MVYPDQEAEFRCEVRSETAVVYFINGTDQRRLSNSEDINVANDGLNRTLTINAKTNYNNTIVMCEASEEFGSGFELSDNVTLTIQGTCIYIILLLCTCMYYVLCATSTYVHIIMYTIIYST